MVSGAVWLWSGRTVQACAENTLSFSYGGVYLWGRECPAFTYSAASAGKSYL